MPLPHTPPQGPSFEAPMAIADAATPNGEARRTKKTSVTEPLTYEDGATPQKSKRGLVIGLLAAVLGAVVAFLIIHKLTSKGDEGAKQIAAVTIDAAPMIATPPVAADAAAAAAPDADVGSGSGSGSGSAEIQIEGSGSAVAVIEPTHPKNPNPGHPTHPVHPKGAGSGSAQPEVKVPPPPPPPSDGVTASAVAALYQSVGRDVETLRGKKGDDAISDVLPRYRLVNLNDAITTPAKREAALAALASIQRDIRAKLK
jgi:hypothetical protein